jgi:hypothetical protein
MSLTSFFRRCRLLPPIPIGTIAAVGRHGPQIVMRDMASRRQVIEPGAFDHFAAAASTAR